MGAVSMRNDIVRKYLDIIVNESNEILDIDASNFYLYALRVKNWKDSKNPLISLSYEFYDSQMAKDLVKYSLEMILKFAKKKYNDDSEVVYEPYNPNNSKTVIDYIILNKLDFKNPAIESGIIKNIDGDNYKVEYLLNAMCNSTQISKKELKNFTGIKYTVIHCSSEKHTITVINKGNPIYKPKKLLFSLDMEGVDKLNFNYNPIKDAIFKIPFYPGILIIDNLCLFIDDKIETLFGFTEHIKMIREEKLSDIKNCKFINLSSFNYINKFSYSGKNYNYFSTFDEKRLKFIENQNVNAIRVLKNIGLKFQNNDLIIENENDAEKFVAYLCHVLKKDIFDDNELSISLNNKKLNNH